MAMAEQGASVEENQGDQNGEIESEWSYEHRRMMFVGCGIDVGAATMRFGVSFVWGWPRLQDVSPTTSVCFGRRKRHHTLRKLKP